MNAGTSIQKAVELQKRPEVSVGWIGVFGESGNDCNGPIAPKLLTRSAFTPPEQHGSQAHAVRLSQAVRQKHVTGQSALLNILKSPHTKRRTIVQAIVNLLWQWAS